VSCPNDSTTEDRYGMYCCVRCGGPTKWRGDGYE
jgi:hypothetical protein